MRIARVFITAIALSAVYACSDSTGPSDDDGPGIFTSVSAGFNHACAVDTIGRAWCWGDNYRGQLGVDPNACESTDCATRPVLVNTSLRFTSVSAGSEFSCGIATDSTAHCWGNADGSRLGVSTVPTSCRPSVECSASPIAVSGGHRFAQLVASSAGACGITGTGAGLCWGLYSAGLSPTANPTPVGLASTSELAWTQLGGSRALINDCGITATGVTACWGSNSSGQIGNGTVGSTIADPAEVTAPVPMKSVHAGNFFACAIAVDGDAYCWGLSRSGSLGIGLDAPSVPCTTTGNGLTCHSTPLKVVGGRKYSAMAAGLTHVCAIEASSGNTWCWGSNTGFAIGSPQYLSNASGIAPSPLPAAGDLKFQALSAGNSFTCALASDRNVYCWGTNGRGQLGLLPLAANGPYVPNSISPRRVSPVLP